MCGTIKQTLKNKTRMETQIKFYKVMITSVGSMAVKSGYWQKKDKNRI
jgi:hypothetical protein